MRIKRLVGRLCAATLVLICHGAFAENIDAETKASMDITEDDSDGITANFALVCRIRDFDWVSAVNSMVLERAARDIDALRRAGGTSDYIRMQWEIIARGMTLYRSPETINCDNLIADVLKLDTLAAQGGYKNYP